MFEWFNTWCMRNEKQADKMGMSAVAWNVVRRKRINWWHRKVKMYGRPHTTNQTKRHNSLQESQYLCVVSNQWAFLYTFLFFFLSNTLQYPISGEGGRERGKHYLISNNSKEISTGIYRGVHRRALKNSFLGTWRRRFFGRGFLGRGFLSRGFLGR